MKSEFNEHEVKLQSLTTFCNEMKGKLEQSKIDEISREFLLSDKDNFYGAEFVLTCYVLSASLEVVLDNNVTFNGSADALGTPGKGKYWGKVYTSNYDELIDNTDNFWHFSNLTASTIMFFDKHNSFLGSFAGAGISSVLSTGAGNGQWAPIE
ncbi:VapA/VapB family virulence-associated protein [Xenorhabdus khoisanae]|uniref:VapA/VapB family virulence-associated protein n=1 Tax=Xenorhabdus khoisanae TaxID=880157 RepID=UPI0032B7D915